MSLGLNFILLCHRLLCSLTSKNAVQYKLYINGVKLIIKRAQRNVITDSFVRGVVTNLCKLNAESVGRGQIFLHQRPFVVQLSIDQLRLCGLWLQ